MNSGWVLARTAHSRAGVVAVLTALAAVGCNDTGALQENVASAGLPAAGEAGAAVPGAGVAAAGIPSAAGVPSAGSSAAAGGGTAGGGAPSAGTLAAGKGASGASGGSTAGAGGSAGGTTAAAGCGGESFMAIYRDVFMNSTMSCAAAPCHGRKTGLDLVGNLDMSTPQGTYTALVGKTSDSMMCGGKQRVKAGDAQNSMLVRKLREDTVDCGGLMPLSADPIDEASFKRIVNWVNGGACNN